MKAPNFPVAPILEALGGENVPHVTGTGHRKMLCPFHPDRTPSASVSQYGFTCYACGATGDAIKLIRTYEGGDYQTALRRVEEIVGGTDGDIPSAADSRSGWWAGSVFD